jgi:hypothetical protein
VKIEAWTGGTMQRRLLVCGVWCVVYQTTMHSISPLAIYPPAVSSLSHAAPFHVCIHALGSCIHDIY